MTVPISGHLDAAARHRHQIRNALTRLMVRIEDVQDAVPPDQADLAQAVARLLDEVEAVSSLIDSGE